MSVCRKVGSQSGDEIHEIFSNCTECGHTRGVHPGAMNKGLTACVTCELLTPPTCQRPPKDWEPCRRTPGHNGTCSPYPDVSEASLAQPLTVPFFDIPLYGVPEEGLISDAPSPYLDRRILKQKPNGASKRAYRRWLQGRTFAGDFLDALRKLWQPELLLLSVALTVYGFCFYWACTR